MTSESSVRGSHVLAGPRLSFRRRASTEVPKFLGGGAVFGGLRRALEIRAPELNQRMGPTRLGKNKSDHPITAPPFNSMSLRHGEIKDIAFAALACILIRLNVL
jgi:hypothetical protein